MARRGQSLISAKLGFLGGKSIVYCFVSLRTFSRNLSKHRFKETDSLLSNRLNFFLKTIFVLSHMYPENPDRTQVIVGSMNMEYISDTARNRTHNLFRPKWDPIPLGHSDGRLSSLGIFILSLANGDSRKLSQSMYNTSTLVDCAY